MGEEGPAHRQMRFENGQLVPAVEGSRDSPGPDDAIEPGAETGFSVAVDPAALAANDALAMAHENYGPVLTFGSRGQAVAYAERLATDEGALVVRDAAPTDGGDVDAYLLARDDRATASTAEEHDLSADSRDGASEGPSDDGEGPSDDGEEPAEREDLIAGARRFDVDRSLAHALAETVVTAGTNPPALERFVRDDLGVASDDDLAHGLRVQALGSGAISFGDAETGDLRSWAPDCKVEARDGWNGELLAEYWCAVEVGDDPVDPDRLATMRELARTADVLTIRVAIDALPERYAVRIDAVAPADA